MATNYSGPWMYQQYTSAKTCVNQVPAAFKRIEWIPGTVNLDYGGGRFDTATNYLYEQGVTNLVFDPFNRSMEHNIGVLHHRVRANTATLCNVLNVVKERCTRHQILKNLKSLVKREGQIYISCYRGRGTEPTVTTRGWQENRPLETYLEEVHAVFPDAVIVGKMIVAYPHTEWL